MPSVSIITPVYNGERFIREAINSALAQTYTDWELIIVDDGSTDSTPDILREFTDQRIRRIRQPNQGEATARNTGLAAATGEFIAFLDADDAFLPSALADLVAMLNARPEVDAIYSDGYFCDEHGHRLMRLTEHRPGIYSGNILEPLVLSASVITVPICTLTRRSIIEREQLRFDPQLVIGPDYDFWIRLARHARFAYLDNVTCLYRVHLTNITRTSGAKKRLRDLVYGRMKILNSDWFQTLSRPTRHKFFYNLLIDLLADQSAEQTAIFDHTNFKQLPPHVQAILYRQVGTDHLLKQSTSDFGIRCLQAAVQIWPADNKSRYLLRVTQLAGRPAIVIVLRIWQGSRRLAARLRAFGKRQPRAVPTSLGPVGS